LGEKLKTNSGYSGRNNVRAIADSNKQQATSNKQQATSNKQQATRSDTDHRLIVALCFLLAAILAMAMIRPAHASGTVNASTLYYGGGTSSGYDCTGTTSLEAVQSCELAMHDKWFANDLAYLSTFTGASVSCPAAALADSGPSGPYVDVFSIAYYRAAHSVGGFWIPVYYVYCDGPKVDNFYIATQLACPANSAPTGSTCTCNDTYVPDTSLTQCVPEPLTVALGGLGGEVMPAKTLDAYALVTTSSGSPKSGAQVILSLDVIPELKGQLPVTYTGTLNIYGGATGADGRLNFTFTAPVAGGEHIITAGCVGCTNVAQGTIKVPGCPESPLTKLTDPIAIDFDNNPHNRWRPDGLTTDYQSKLACVQCEITARHGTYTGTSAYRPTQYQQHLYEIVDKDFKLSRPGYMNAHPECQALKDEVTQEMGPSPGHGLKRKQKVAESGSSRHESGAAFDLTPSGLTDAQLTEVYTTCHVTHTAVPSEPWHTQ
jgi:hypothetical protein